ncbi:MAG: hypothetical protein AAGG48_27910 [Planctomycetota bacterium]
MNNHSSLPDDLRAYLGTENKTWEIGDAYLPYAKLYTFTETPEIECKIRGPGGFSGSCTGIDLVCDVGPHYGSATGALIWVPQCKEYGYWNQHQHIVSLFPGVTLDEIVANPSLYVMGHGTKSRRVFPYFLEPWRQEFTDDPRCTALIVCAKTLQASPEHYAQALRAALLGAQPGLDISPDMIKMIHYLAGRLIQGIRTREDVAQLCDTMLGSIPMTALHASRLEDEAARYEFEHGEEPAAIARLERVVADVAYSEYHERFQRILEHIKNPPPEDS